MLTVLFSSHNGARTLPTTLEAFSRLISPEGGWKILAVDNASSDDTAGIIDSYRGRLPIEKVHEGIQGKNRAQNHGLEHLEGDLVVFTDDDVIPHPEWLVHLRHCSNQRLEYDIFGGRIEPHWMEQPPEWILKAVPLAPVYALTERGPGDGEISPRLVFGGNMAVRKRLFDGGLRFDETVGPKPGGNYIMGSETELLSRLEQEGRRAWFCDKALLKHIIRPFQLEKKWILDRAFRFGRSQYRMKQKNYEDQRKIAMGMPAWMIRRYLELKIRNVIGAILRDDEQRFNDQWESQLLKGMLHEARNAHAGEPRLSGDMLGRNGRGGR